MVFLWVEDREEPLEEKKRERKRREEERGRGGDEEKEKEEEEGEMGGRGVCAMRSVRPRRSGCRNGSRPSWDLGAAFAC